MRPPCCGAGSIVLECGWSLLLLRTRQASRQAGALALAHPSHGLAPGDFQNVGSDEAKWKLGPHFPFSLQLGFCSSREIPNSIRVPWGYGSHFRLIFLSKFHRSQSCPLKVRQWRLCSPDRAAGWGGRQQTLSFDRSFEPSPRAHALARDGGRAAWRCAPPLYARNAY